MVFVYQQKALRVLLLLLEIYSKQKYFQFNMKFTTMLAKSLQPRQQATRLYLWQDMKLYRLTNVRKFDMQVKNEPCTLRRTGNSSNTSLKLSSSMHRNAHKRPRVQL